MLAQVVVEKTLPDGASYDDFVGALTENENSCRYGIFRLHYEGYSALETKTDVKVGLFLWTPETSKVREKMLYSSNQHSVEAAFPGFKLKVKAESPDEIEYINVREIARE